MAFRNLLKRMNGAHQRELSTKNLEIGVFLRDFILTGVFFEAGIARFLIRDEEVSRLN